MPVQKIVLLFIGLCAFCLRGSADTITLALYINTNQCTNCNIALSALHGLSDGVMKTVYFPESNKAASEEMMEPYAGLKNMHLRYFDKAASPFKNAMLPSYCLLYKGGTRIDSFELKELFGNYAAINTMLSPVKMLRLKRKIAIPDSIKLSDRLTVLAHRERLSICDYVLNKNVTLSFDAGFTKISKALQIKGSAFKPQPFLRSGIVDTALYRKIYKDIQFIGKTKPEVNAAYLTDSSLYLLLTFPCGITVQRDTGIGGKLFMYRKNLFSAKSELLPIPDDMLPPHLGEEYFIANLAAFYVSGKKFFFTLYQDQLKKENHFLAEYAESGKRLVFRSLVKWKVSDSTYLNTNFGNTQIFITATNHTFYFAAYQPLIINIKTNAVYNLQEAIGPGYKHGLLLRDVAQLDKDRLCIIASIGNVEKYLVYDTRKDVVVSETEIKFPVSLNMDSLKFLSPGSLAALDEANKALLFFAPD